LNKEQQSNPLHLENTVLRLGRSDLTVPKCFKTYRDMKLDPMVGGSLSFIKALVSKTGYKIKEAKGSTAAQKDLVKAINASIGDTPYGRKRLLDNILSMLDYGTSMFEVVIVRNKKNQWLFEVISPIHLSTVERFTFKQGSLVKVQLAPAENDGLIFNDGAQEELDGKKVLLFRLESDQDFPLGKSLLYGCYTAWKTKSILNEYTTIGAAKNLSTVVKVSLPMEYINAYMQNPLSDEAKYTEELLASVENLHAGKSCYAVIPSDMTSGGQALFDIKGISSDAGNNTFNSEISIDRYNREILFNMQTSVLSLGSNSQGSFSLAENSTNLLGLFIQNLFLVIADEFQKAIKMVWEANGQSVDRMPTLEFEDVDERDLKVFAEAWSKLAGAGAVMNNKETENAIRADFKLPPVDAQEALQGDNTQGVVQ
jgi:hypothetical protein